MWNQILKSEYEVFRRLGDEESKYIWTNRILHSFTKEAQYMRNIAMTNSEVTGQVDRIRHLAENGKNRIWVYGAGIRGKNIVGLYDNITWAGFIDKNLYGKNLRGLDVCRIEDVHFDSNTYVVVPIRSYSGVEKDLTNFGCMPENIIKVSEDWETLEAKQYIDLPYISGDYSTIVDCGAYHGNKISKYIKTWPQIKNIIAIEPDKDNCQVIEEKTRNMNNVTVINKGVWDDNTQLRFSAGNNMTSNINEEGETIVDVISMDSLGIEDNCYITMDVEGAELKALMGAKALIASGRCALAVCIYHKDEDIFELPNYILSINPDVKFYLRHYSFTQYETVLYVLPTGTND